MSRVKVQGITQEINLMVKLALPLMAAFLAQKSMQFIDTLMMGWISPYALAAAALGTSLCVTILIFCMGTLSSVGVFIARARGAGQHDDIQSSLQSGVFLALILSLPGMLLIWNAPKILFLIGEDPRIIHNVILFLHGIVWGFPGFLLFYAFREFIAAFSLTRVVMLVTLISIPLTWVTNYVLIYGKYGLPKLGVAGVGYAGAVIMWFMGIYLFIYSRKHTRLKMHALALCWSKWDFEKIKKMFCMGAPSGGMMVLDIGMCLAAAIMMGYFDVNTLAAHQIAILCASIAFSVPFSLSIATSLRVGYAAGAKDYTSLKRSVYAGIGIGLAASLVLALIFVLFPESLIKLFLNGREKDYGEMVPLAASFLAISALFQCLDAVQCIANGALRGLKDTFIPMLLGVGCYWIIGMGSAYYFAFYTHLKAKGIWYGLTLGICSAGIFLMLRFLQQLRYERHKYHHLESEKARGNSSPCSLERSSVANFE